MRSGFVELQVSSSRRPKTSKRTEHEPSVGCDEDTVDRLLNKAPQYFESFYVDNFGSTPDKSERHEALIKSMCKCSFDAGMIYMLRDGQPPRPS